MPFAKHETFHIRDGWLQKGIRAVEENSNIFHDEQAPEILGLGKNMVRSLRFWLQATGLTEEVYEDRRKVQKLTAFGKLLEEYDPYQELDGTLWILHYHLITNPEFATSWYWFFNSYAPSMFTFREFIDRLKVWINVQPDITRRVAASSLRKDFDCLVRTYLPKQRDSSPEDVLECPLTSLGLISGFTQFDEETRKKERYFRLENGSPDHIHPLVMLYVLLRAQEDNAGSQQIGMQAALRGTGNVGRTFNLRPTILEDLLSALNDQYPDWRVSLTRTAGLDQLTLPQIPAEVVLETYYQEQVVSAREMQVWSRPLS